MAEESSSSMSHTGAPIAMTMLLRLRELPLAPRFFKQRSEFSRTISRVLRVSYHRNRDTLFLPGLGALRSSSRENASTFSPQKSTPSATCSQLALRVGC